MSDAAGPVHAAVSAGGGLYLACSNKRARFPDLVSNGSPVTCGGCLVWLELNRRGNLDGYPPEGYLEMHPDE